MNATGSPGERGQNDGRWGGRKGKAGVFGTLHILRQ